MPIDCDLLTGFLGSGKTTLLNAWLRLPCSAGTAVLVNEIGDVGIDQLILSQVTDNVVLLESGCLCCTLGGSLRETLLDVCAAARAQDTPLTRIVVETTGLAEPQPILHALLGDKILTDAIRLNQVVVTVDGQQGIRQLTSQPEAVRQLAAAECVVVTKADLAPSCDVTALRRAIDCVNPRAAVFVSIEGSAAEQIFTSAAGDPQRQAVFMTADQSASVALRGEFKRSPDTQPKAPANHGGEAPDPQRSAVLHDCHTPHHDHASAHFHSRVSTLGFHLDHPVTWPGISAWWHLVSNRYGDDLLRSKGLFQVQNAAQPYVFMQTVGKVFHPPSAVSKWPDADGRSRLVCIGVDLDAAWMQESLTALRITEPGVLPMTLTDLACLAPSAGELV